MMSKPNAPIHSYKNPVIYYSKWILSTNPNFNRPYRLYLKSYINLDNILKSSFNLFQSLENLNCLIVCLENLAVQPNSEKVNNLFQSLENSNCFCLFVCLEILSLGGLMPACRPEDLPDCNFQYNLWGKHAEYFDQQMGARHPMWCNKDVKLMKVCTIIKLKEKLRLQNVLKGKLPTRSFFAFQGTVLGVVVVGGGGGGGHKNVEASLKISL